LADTEVALVDRSGRRCALLDRAIRVLGLENVEVVQSDISDLRRTVDAVVSRASLPPSELLSHLQRMTEIGIVAGSTRSAPEVGGYRSVEIVSRYLESPRWLLIMQTS
jgi:16S rRNA G527 N7-methylase RsmG